LEWNAIARSLELQGKLGSKPIFFIALLLSFFRNCKSEGHDNKEFGSSLSFFSLLELQRLRPWHRQAQLVIIMDLFLQSFQSHNLIIFLVLFFQTYRAKGQDNKEHNTPHHLCFFSS
jgi:hypothetical protein